MGGTCSIYGKMKKMYKIIIKPEGKRPFGRPRRR
jgi:hypothetical protein